MHFVRHAAWVCMCREHWSTRVRWRSSMAQQCIEDKPEIHKVMLLELKGCKATRMSHHNNIMEAYLTRLHLLGEHIKTLHHANTKHDEKQGVGHREHHFSEIVPSTLRLASFTIHLLFPLRNHIHKSNPGPIQGPKNLYT